MAIPDEPPLQANISSVCPPFAEEVRSLKEKGEQFDTLNSRLTSTPPEYHSNTEFSELKIESSEKKIDQIIIDLFDIFSAKDKEIEKYKCENNFLKEQIKFLKEQINKLIEYQSKSPITINNEVKVVAESQSNSDTFTTNLQGVNIGNLAHIVRDHARQQTNQYNYDLEQKQSLVKVATEIQQVLDKLSQTYPTITDTQRMTLATKAIEEIEGNSHLRTRILSALKAGGVGAFEQLLNHPAASFVITALKDWQNTGRNSG